MNSLNACASTLFSLISRIRNRAQHMDPDALRRNVVAEVRAFESRALQAGDPQTVKVARYVLCATIDDVVLNTPWGGQSAWTQQSLVGTFHKEVVGGDRFFDVLARLEQEPAKNIDLLEFIYVCLSLGFEGRLRVEPGGQDKHLQIRNGLARIIRAQRGPVERDLSPHWKGVDRAHKPLSAWLAIWVTLGAVAAVLGLGYFALTWALGGLTGRLVGQLSALDAGVVAELQRRAPPPPPPAELPGQDQVNALAQFLAPEIEQKLVTVLENANTITVRIVGEGMFGSGSDSLQPAFVDPLSRVAAAMNEQPGPVIVAGHSDNVPIKTARFPSNMHLSLARAESVMRQLAAGLEDPSRLSAEGRADKEPIASNATAEGQARNRRIEVILVKVAPK
jgi:type VI secretion system protein ImpK